MEDWCPYGSASGWRALWRSGLSPHKALQLDDGVGRRTQAQDMPGEGQPLCAHKGAVCREIAAGAARTDDHDDVGCRIAVEIAEQEVGEGSIAWPDRAGRVIVIGPSRIKGGVEP